MPLLPREPFLLPRNLFEESRTVEGARWWVLHTRPRVEKCLARAAHRLDVPYFLPLHTRHWRTNGRRFSAHLPLFPGYLFMHGDEEMRMLLVDTHLVVHCIPVLDQPRLWRDLGRVYQLMDSGVSLSPVDRLQPGARVRITTGPLIGFIGTLLRHGGDCRLVVEVEFIQRGVAVEVEDWMVEPVAEAAGNRPR